MSDLIKKEPSARDLLTQAGKPQAKPGSLADRARAAKEKAKTEVADALSVPNRICLMLDCSGSMSGYGSEAPIELLKKAVEAYTNACNFNDTAIALEPFPMDSYGAPYRRLPLTTNKFLIQTEGQKMSATGSTPIHDALKSCIENNPITRAVLVSDGGPDSEELAFKELGPYIEMKIKVDCVHIGISSGGEDFLKAVAERTGGLYFKFKDIGQFVGSFKYLTPALRGYLTSGEVKLGDQ